MEADVEILFLSRRTDGSFFQYPLIERAPVLGMRYKVKKEFNASITGITVTEGSVNSSNVTIKPNAEIELIPSLKKGDIVFVAFAQRALDNLQSKPFDPGTIRKHDIRDAVVLGVHGL
ncbi:MAG: hypothetical protein ACQET8_17445 [Bacillota bacterium]